MSAIEILPDLFFFERGYLNGNHFAYRSEEPVLVDTAYKSDLQVTEQLITSIGVDLNRVSLIISTHSHCDHIGGNKSIQEKSHCRIAMHKIGKHFVDTEDDWSTWWRYYRQEADFFACSQSLQEGDTVNVGPHEFQVIHTPGHAADGIVLYHRGARILLSSDTLWENDIAVMTARIEGSSAVFAMLESLEKVRNLDVRMVYPGHGRPFTDAKAAIQKAAKRFEQYLSNPGKIGEDLIKKIMVYTLMMKRGMDAEALFPYLMTTPWYVETADLYFSREYRAIYDNILARLTQRDIVRIDHGRIHTTVKP
jgi:hydroxyacylglutathione hydrolase